MSNLSTLAAELRDAQRRADLTQAALSEKAGISPRTLGYVLSGQEDFRVSTLLALADRLGLSVLLVPKAAAPALAAGLEVKEPAVVSQVADALAKVQAQIEVREKSAPYTGRGRSR